MYKQVLNSIQNVEMYPIITLVLFVVFFFSMIAIVAGMDKDTVSHASQLPLDDQEAA
jgi:hypothetical protein